MYDTIEAAMQAVAEAEHDVAADFGEEMVEAAYSDLVHNIAGDCPPEVRAELLRRTLGITDEARFGRTWTLDAL